MRVYLRFQKKKKRSVLEMGKNIAPGRNKKLLFTVFSIPLGN